MIERIAPRQRRFLALGFLALAVLLLLCLTVVPLAASTRSEIEQRQLSLKELSKLQGLVAAEPQLRDALDKVEALPMWQRVYHGPGASAAEPGLQADFRALADAQGITVDTLQPLDASTEKEFTRLALRVGFNTTIDHLGQLLAAMEAAPHVMQFKNLYITSPMSQGGGNAPLVVRGDLSAYLLVEAER